MLDGGREGGLGRTRPHLFFIPVVSYFLPPSKLNLGWFCSDFSLREYLFFLDFPSLTESSGGIWLNCFIHGLTLPSSCFLPSLVFSSKVPALQLLTPSSGLHKHLWGADSSAEWEMEAPLASISNKRCLILIPAPHSAVVGLGKLSAPTLLHFPEGSLVQLHFGGGDFLSSTNKRPRS